MLNLPSSLPQKGNIPPTLHVLVSISKLSFRPFTTEQYSGHLPPQVTIATCIYILFIESDIYRKAYFRFGIGVFGRERGVNEHCIVPRESRSRVNC